MKNNNTLRIFPTVKQGHAIGMVWLNQLILERGPGVLGAVPYRCTLFSILICAEGLYLCAKIAELEPCMD